MPGHAGATGKRCAADTRGPWRSRFLPNELGRSTPSQARSTPDRFHTAKQQQSAGVPLRHDLTLLSWS
jgi:hypothetical protein